MARHLPQQEGRTISIVSAMYVQRNADGMFIHLSFGRIIDEMAERFDKVYLCVPVLDMDPSPSRDYRISASNIVLVPQPAFTSSAAALQKPIGIILSYWKLCSRGGHVFIRGMVPFLFFLYLFSWLRGRGTCHWLVGNPEALLASHKRSSSARMFAARLISAWDRRVAKVGRRLCGGSFLCNGDELGRLYPSDNTRVVVSSTVRSEEIFRRDDACTHDRVNLLFVGFIRPEKGIEYLLKALPLLNLKKEWRLSIVGDFDKFGDYKNRISHLIEELDLASRIDWLGYIPYGDKLFAVLRSSDIMILPTLSEGTPRVLVEARASGLPVIASEVGGIPTSITNGVDGVLVPPKSPEAIASAVERIAGDPVLCRSLVNNGFTSASGFTVEAFAAQVAELCSSREAQGA